MSNGYVNKDYQTKDYLKILIDYLTVVDWRSDIVPDHRLPVNMSPVHEPR